jgi:hypothetical protein
MEVGDLVKRKDDKHNKAGLLWRIGSPNPIARILWSDGSAGAMHIKYLEVTNADK